VTEYVAIPHCRAKPAWLEDDALVAEGENYVFLWPAAERIWGGRAYLLPADHWAAPVLIYNRDHGTKFLPWNAALQGPKAPLDYNGGMVMRADGIVCDYDRRFTSWYPAPPGFEKNTIIGYEPASDPCKLPTPAPTDHAAEVRVEHIRAWRDALAKAAAERGEPMFLGKPDGWHQDPHWFCPNGHVSGNFLKGDDGDRCLACHEPVLLGPPIGEEAFGYVLAALAIPAKFEADHLAGVGDNHLRAILSAQKVEPYRGWNITELNKAGEAARAYLGLPSVRDLNPDIAALQDHAARLAAKDGPQ